MIAAMPLRVGEAAFAAWLATAQPGEHLAYHEGQLCFDRTFRISEYPEPMRAELNRIAIKAMNMAEQGRVLLAQRRVSHDRVAYVVIKAGAGQGEPS